MALLSFATKETNVVEMLRTDHEKVKALFRDFEAESDGKRKESLVQQVVNELEIHAAAEEAVFYPAVRGDSPDAEDKLDESLEEHHVAKLLMRELKHMSAGDKRYDAKVRVLAESVKHHMKEEEAELFARARTGHLDLMELGKRLEAAKAEIQSTPPARRSNKRTPSSGKAPAGRKSGSKRTARKAARRPVA